MRILFTTPERKTFWFKVPENVKVDKAGFIVIDKDFKELNDHIDFDYLNFDLEHRGLPYDQAFYDAKDRRNDKISHRDYYQQFLRLHELEAALLRHFGKEAFLASEDEYLNNIPLKKWDRFNVKPYIKSFMYKVANNANYSEETQRKNPFLWSPSSNVCLAKQGGYILREKLKAAA